MTTAIQSTGEQAALFDVHGDGGLGVGDDTRIRRTRNSVLWAAYGDALGFISELVTEKALKRRTKGAELDHLMAWTRRVGGRGGVEVELPAGCWSDDTQLRSAVSRAIDCHGFDVDMFARIELPIWPSYALGGGRASKAAAASLGKPKAMWYANTFRGWTDAGGNGAAMRVQPHVWASLDLDGDYMLDVITDSVCTHGHPRAIVGACFHAATLAQCLRDGAVPGPSRCEEIAAGLAEAPSLIEEHRSLGSTWVALWERATGKRLREAWQVTVDELRTAIAQVANDTNGAGNTSEAYRGISARLGLMDKAQRGSGILTPVAAVALAAAAPSAHEAAVVAANEIGTDTDTIATMAGALLGACEGAAEPPERPLDSDYLLREADRLVAIAQGDPATSHSYPDILTWTAPQAQADALVQAEDRLAVEGLGEVTELSADMAWTTSKDFAWQWVKTEFGQTLLIKRRPELRPSKTGNALVSAPAVETISRRDRAKPLRSTSNRSVTTPLSSSDFESALRFARKWRKEDDAIGRAFRDVANNGTREDFLALAEALYDDLRH
ncbi:MAG: ADP-ribosylglycohydrolase family protein [Acidimicrobiia bacterium]|nr:ADP-ribosylglycohydrolase family protein [Acidimicrobiia bacterium]MYC43948.1 ADP-ribosylglycohydrolase family protein [Acidimicrobiia bacterium]MYI21084.1 ADP-ribosylglycohydrolase family protein [Acidimicrobiia bacterium]